MRHSGVATKVLSGLVAVCALAFAPLPTASAGCGDYLTMDHGKGASSDLSAPARPCNGPNCHRHDAPPLSPAPEFQTAPPSVKIAAVFGDACDVRPSLIERRQDEAFRPLTGVPLSILRPPRSV
jgi:hypothetical protein